MLTAKLVTDALGQFASCQQLISLHHFALGMDPVGFYRVEPGAFGGQGAGQNPYPTSFSFDLTVVLLNPALHFLAKVPGGIVPPRSNAFLPRASSLLQTHARKAVVTPLMGRPSTKRNHTSSWGGAVVGCQRTIAHSRPGLWGQGHPWARIAPPAAKALQYRSRCASWGGPTGQTNSRPRTPRPSPDGWPPAESAGPEPLFSGICGVGAGNPRLGPLPAHP